MQFATLSETISLALSSPPLTTDALKASKVYIFLVRGKACPSRETIIGCIIAQRITTAMAIASPAQLTGPPADRRSSSPQPGISTDQDSAVESLIPVHIDPTTSLYVYPTPLPTPLGISRIFVSSGHRRQGVAQHLLSAAAATFIHGFPLDPAQGHVAFTQPTIRGHAVMESWGKGGVRIYED
jgi:N-acetyltransferase